MVQYGLGRYKEAQALRKDHRGAFGRIIKGKEVLGSKKVFTGGTRKRKLDNSTTLILK